jgi:peptidoglycan/LPS O-acetylase OafA/YrhL
MKRRLPLMIGLVSGLFFTIQFFIPHQEVRRLYADGLRWLIVVATFAVILALGSLITRHTRKVQRKEKGWGYSIVTLVALLGMAIAGFSTGTRPGTLFNKLFLNVQAPMQSTMFGILAFYIASASYRAFRARSKEATLLLLAAFLLMLSAVSFVSYYFPHVTTVSEWLLMVPNLAAQRGILFGVFLGTLATSIKIILGIERGWMGGGK